MNVELNKPFKSKAKNKKYSVYVKSNNKKGYKIIHFGDSRYEQYEDTTGLGHFSHKNHFDKERRKRYYDRHGRNPKKYSAKWFSHKYLW